jgi:hypothetical protein
MNTLFSIYNVLIERYCSMSTKLVFESLIIERPDVLRRNSKDRQLINTMSKRTKVQNRLIMVNNTILKIEQYELH